MLDDFLMRAFLAGIAVACAAALLGCFVVWRRMAYFGDATAHASILGVALALAGSVPIFAGVLFVSLIMAGGLYVLTSRDTTYDSLLGVLSHSALAFGLLAFSFLPNVRVSVDAYLFGDLLAVSKGDLGVIWIGSCLVSALVLWRWSRFIVTTLDPDMAAAEGINARKEQLILTVALAVLVAMAIKITGALLITALLIIPAASARPLSRTPEVMAFFAVLFGGLAVCGGLWGAYEYDSHVGPSIVATLAVIFALIQLGRAIYSWRIG